MADNTQKIIDAMNNLASEIPAIRSAADSFDKFDISDLVDAVNRNTFAHTATGSALEALVEQEVVNQKAEKDRQKLADDAEETRQKTHNKYLKQSSDQIRLNREMIKHLGSVGKIFKTVGEKFNILKNFTGMKNNPMTRGLASLGSSIGKGAAGGAINLKNFSFGSTLRGLATGLSKVKNAASSVKNVFSMLSANPYVLAFKKTVGFIFGKMYENFKMGLKYGTMFAKFFIGLPLKITGAAAKIGNELREQIVVQIGNAVEQTKEFADSTSGLGKGIQNISDMSINNLSRFKNVRGDLVKLFGTGTQGVTAFISEIQKGMEGMNQLADTVGASIAKNEESALFFVKATRSMGMGAAEIEYITAEAVKNGESIYQAMDNVLVSISNTADSFGLDKKKMSKNFFELRKDIINFGHLTNSQLAETTAKLTQMGLSMKEASAVFGKIDTFESAAQTSAMLSQTFGMNLDALQLLRAEKPEEIIEQFRDAMLSTGRAFDDLNRHEKALMQTHTGLTAEALKLTMNYRNMGMSFAEIQQRMKEDDPTVQQIKNLELMSGSLKEIKATMAGDNFFYSFANGIAHTIKTSSGLTPHLLRASEAMEDFFISGLTLSKKANRAIASAFKPVTDVIVEMVGDGKNKKGFFDAERFKPTFESFAIKIGGFLSEAFDKKSNILDVQYRFKEFITKSTSWSSLTSKGNIVGTLMTSGGKVVGQFLKGFAALGPGILEVVGKSFRSLTDFIIGYKDGDSSIMSAMSDLLQLTPEDREAVSATFTKLIQVIENDVFPSLTRLFFEINKKILGLFKDTFNGIMDMFYDTKFGKILSAIEGATAFFTGGLIGDLQETRLQTNIDNEIEIAKKRKAQLSDLSLGYLKESLIGKDSGDFSQSRALGKIMGVAEAQNDAKLKSLLEDISAGTLQYEYFGNYDEKINKVLNYIKDQQGSSISLDVEQINGRLQAAKGKLLGPGMMATVTDTPNGLKVSQHAIGDVTLTAKPSEISYAGLTDLSSTSSANMRQRNMQNNNADARPVSLNISIPVDGKVLTQVALDHDILAEAMKPGRSRFTFADGVVLDASGNPIEGRGV